MNIGFFDSGLGGLFVMQQCQKDHPEYNYTYLGDTQNLPYGPKTTEEIYLFSTPCILYLLEKEYCDYVIVACNTVSVRALDLFKVQFPDYADRVIGINIPTQMHLSNESCSSLLVLATQQTVKSGVYRAYSSHQVPMPGLVDLIESDDREAAVLMCTDVISAYPETKNILLGCTHYLWLQDELEKLFPTINIIGQGVLMSNYLSTLEKKKMSNKEDQYLLTANTSDYHRRYQLPFKKITL